MTKTLDPIISEFETQEQADSYDKWFRAKVQAAIDDPRPGIPHDPNYLIVYRVLIDRIDITAVHHARQEYP